VNVSSETLVKLELTKSRLFQGAGVEVIAMPNGALLAEAR